ncbi:MAG TPA: helix-turn-helix transcriptional regulator [Fibrobacteraceae bacterium]|nr:helix-turn-helix transcriptional regulator [Fibrobacteraceae bacterium]
MRQSKKGQQIERHSRSAVPFAYPLTPPRGTKVAESSTSLAATAAAHVILRKNLKNLLRLQKFPTFEKFAHECGIPKSTLSQILNHTRDPRLGTLEQIAKALRLRVPDLFQLPDPLPWDWNDL